MMILVVYYSCTITVKLRLWPTKYRRNRVNFVSFVWSAMLILKGQWGWFWWKRHPWGFPCRLTCHPVLLSLGWGRSDLTVEMNPGLLVSGRHFSPRLWAPRSQRFRRSRLRLVVAQEIQARCTGRPSLYLYHSLGCQEGSRLVGWSTCWPFPHNDKG